MSRVVHSHFPVLLILALLLVLVAGCDGDDGDSNGGGDGNTGLDPAPNRNQPGEYGCNGCPDSDVEEFEQNVGSSTATSFSGTVTNAIGDGVFYVVTAEGNERQEIRGAIATDPDTGTFGFTIPVFCGTQLVKCVWSNAAGSYVLVVQVVREDCTEPDIRVTLVWDDLGRDFELHLIRPGGKINDDVSDCTWFNCIGDSPDWGVIGDPSDDPQKDVDDLDAYGPENIFLAKPAAGIYTVMVEHWNSSGDPRADGTVFFNVGGKTTVATVSNLAPWRVWTAGTIEWPSGKVTTSRSVFDCTEQWTGGCGADIP